MDIQKCQLTSTTDTTNTPGPTPGQTPFDISTVNDGISNNIPYEISDDDQPTNEEDDPMYGEEEIASEAMESYPTIIPDFHPILQDDDEEDEEDEEDDNIMNESPSIMPRTTTNTSLTSTVQHPFTTSQMTTSPSKNDFLTNNTTHPSLYNYTPL